MGIIYQIENDLNNKKYIGKTISTLMHRWDQHKSLSTTGTTHLYKAMRRDGIEHFHISVVEDNIPDDKLNEREIYWIDLYKTKTNGYNETIGGDGRKWIDRDEVKQLYQEGLSCKEIADSLGVWSSSIIDVLKELNLYDPQEIQQRKGRHNSIVQNPRRLCQYSECLQLIVVYDSIYDASQKTGFNINSIKTAAYTQTGYKGYFWVFEGEQLPEARPLKQCVTHKIGQYDLEGNLIALFSSAAEASKATHTDASGIIKVCKGHRKKCNNFIWRYEE